MAEWSIAAVLKTVELRGSGGSNPSLSANQNEERVRWGSFFVCRHMGINLLNGNVHRYKKESCYATSSFWFAQDARGRGLGLRRNPSHILLNNNLNNLIQQLLRAKQHIARSRKNPSPIRMPSLFHPTHSVPPEHRLHSIGQRACRQIFSPTAPPPNER